MKKDRAFTLIETILAVLILSIASSIGFLTIQYVLNLHSITFNKLIANYLAQEGIEIVRNIRDNNWLSDEIWNKGLLECNNSPNFCEIDYNDTELQSTTSLRYLRYDNNSNFYNYETGALTNFQRRIIITTSTASTSVEVSVIWHNRGKTSSTTAQEILYNWK